MEPDAVERVVLAALARKHRAEDYGPSDGLELRYQMPRMRMNVNVGQFRKGVPAVVTALVAHYMTTGQLGVEAVLAAAVNATQAMRFLKDDQLDVVEFILREAKQPYGDGMTEADLRKSYTDATLDFEAVLASLQKSRVLVRENGRVWLTK